jgi:hypothetical protein
MIGLEEQFLNKIPEDGYISWEEFGRQFLKYFYTPRQHRDDLKWTNQLEGEPFGAY